HIAASRPGRNRRSGTRSRSARAPMPTPASPPTMRRRRPTGTVAPSASAPSGVPRSGAAPGLPHRRTVERSRWRVRWKSASQSCSRTRPRSDVRMVGGMTTQQWTPPRLGSRYADEFPELSVPWEAARADEPHLVALNEELAAELGLDADGLRSTEGLLMLVGNRVPEGATPVAQAYAGHQFGGFSPRLGDGRALLLGELPDGRDLHLKGSGRTPFARGGDGLAAVGPMLREYLISEAMHALGVPTTRSLAVVATGNTVLRESPLPGAVLARVASSHLRVGTFQFARSSGDVDLVRRLADHAIARHHPHAADAENPYLALFTAVQSAQASLIADWMAIGFIHGVMNTDNTTISGESIDYGPCAFMESFDAATVFSSIDAQGR